MGNQTRDANVDIRERNLTIAMARKSLKGLPQHPLAGGFSLRWFCPGDESLWRSIQVAADPYNHFDEGRFAREFGADTVRLQERQCFLCSPEGEAVGTATGWSGQAVAEEIARVHWVAILPGFQGRGLSKPLLTAVCERLRALGHERVFLTTSTARIVAIRLYLGYGFEPLVRSPGEESSWRELEPHLRGSGR